MAHVAYAVCLWRILAEVTAAATVMQVRFGSAFVLESCTAWLSNKGLCVHYMQAKKVRRVQSAFEMFNRMMQTPGKSELTLTELRVSQPSLSRFVLLLCVKQLSQLSHALGCKK